MDEQIVVYGTTWCGDSRRTKRLFDDNKIDYRWVDIDRDKNGKTIVEDINHGNRSVPTIVFPDGTILVEPPIKTLAEKLGVEPPKSFF